MKKYFFSSLMLVVSLCMLSSCDKKDDDNSGGGISQIDFVENYFSIENGLFCSGAMPESTSTESLGDIEMNDKALASGSNFIRIASNKEFSSFLVGVEGVDAYYEVGSSSVAGTRADQYFYVIPLTYGPAYSTDIVMIIKGRDGAGNVTIAYKKKVTYVESLEGDLTINLTFDRERDLDLHLLTPSGNHIFYNDRYWEVETSDGRTISYGLDHDSNADCMIDGLNNENIVIPEEAIEGGIYQIYLEMYKNCEYEEGIDLNWQLAVRYKGRLVKNTLTLPTEWENSVTYDDKGSTVKSTTSEKNPVWGKYPWDAHERLQQYVMTFQIKPASRGETAPKIKSIYKPTLIDIAKEMDRQEGIR
jgi:hypothetical protein